jgi:LmbE family N-acetylglucosaminyl deacetylase
MLSVLDLTRVKRCFASAPIATTSEIGAGTICTWPGHPDLEVKWVVFAGRPAGRGSAPLGGGFFLAGTSTKSDIVINGFRDGFFPFQGELIKETFEDLKSSFAPDLILTHHDDDRHQDHRLISHLTWNTWRDHMILEYEIMKYDGDLGRPNLFVPLSRDLCQDKIGSLLEVFPSQARQARRQWFNEEAFWSLLRLRGIECNAPSRLAEAFFVRKILA